MGQRDNFSSRDVEKLNNMYKCRGLVTGLLPNSGIDAESETFDNVDTTPTTARPFPLLNLIGNLVGAAIAG